MVAQRRSDGEPSEPSEPDEALHLIFDLTKDATERQDHDWEVQDARLFQTLAAASVVLGFAGFTASRPQPGPTASTLLLAALVAYGGVAALVLYGAWAGRIRLLRNHTPWLWHDYKDAPADAIRIALVENQAANYEKNAPVIARKVTAFKWALTSLVLEVSAVVLALASERLAT